MTPVSQPMFLKTKTRETHLPSSEKVVINKPAKSNTTLNRNVSTGWNPRKPVMNNLFCCETTNQMPASELSAELEARSIEERKGVKEGMQHLYSVDKPNRNVLIKDPHWVNPSSWFTTIGNKNVNFPSSETNNLGSSSSKLNLSKKPNIYDLKDEIPKKLKRPVSNYVTNSSNRNSEVNFRVKFRNLTSHSKSLKTRW